MDNCKTCLYSNFLENGDVMCDKVILLYGKEVHVPTDNVDKPCPSHSSRFIEETRYYFNNKDMRNSENSCEVCGRLVDLNDISQYGYIEVQDEKGNVNGEKLQCRICRGKGRR